MALCLHILYISQWDDWVIQHLIFEPSLLTTSAEEYERTQCLGIKHELTVNNLVTPDFAPIRVFFWFFGSIMICFWLEV